MIRHALAAASMLLWLLPEAAANDVTLEGEPVQGGIVSGQAPPGSAVVFDGRPLRVTADGRFLFGFGRDAEGTATLEVRRPDGRIERRTLPIVPRRFDVQRIDGLPPAKVTPRSEEDLRRIREDGAAITSARSLDSATGGAFEPWIWPVTGPVTGVYGSQRILNGQPRSPHKGVDVAAPRGTTVAAAAAGTVSLAAADMYFTGHTVMIDHGHGLHSIYAHLDRLHVAPGDEIGQGAPVGTVGSTGRATGPHLHFGAYWFQEAVDPLLLTGPMPAIVDGEQKS